MKERGMLFSAPMVRALLNGSKTQTRRVMKPVPQMVTDKQIVSWDGDAAALMRLLDQVGRSCPYGQTGDRIWVRETFCRDKWAMGYRADGICGCWGYDGDGNRIFNEHGRLSENAKGFVPTRFPAVYGDRWIPSIHMPREASRIDLEITGVRVERLQDITEGDAIAEGIQPIIESDGPNYFTAHIDGWNLNSSTAFGAYQMLWEWINGAGSWDANPWVWVIEFNRVKP